MDRATSLRAIQTTALWDVVVIGGGATGLGAAVDAAARGFRTLLIEQGDFAQGTSSRSTKLIHGGLRYLRQGNLRLVREGLHERGLLLRNAPQLVHPLPFIIPVYTAWESPFYGVGLKLYDWFAGSLGLAPARRLSRAETLERLPTLCPRGLRGGWLYHDAQFDDSRLAIALAQTLADLGGTPLNYAPVTELLKRDGKICGVRARDAESGVEFDCPARAVINATGVFCDAVRHFDEPAAPALITPSQGAHVVLDRAFLPGETALMIPRTADGRVLFAIPWHGRVLVGTTDTPVKNTSLDPRPLAHEIDFLLAHAARHLTTAPNSADILSAFAGLRPLLNQTGTRRTAALPRDHAVLVSPSGLVTITGGKWTTYRRMGADAVEAAARAAGLPDRPSRTATLALSAPLLDPSTDLPTTVLQAVRHEMARTVADVLARRTRALLLDARASLEVAPQVAKLIASEFGRDPAWEASQTAAWRDLALHHLPPFR